MFDEFDEKKSKAWPKEEAFDRIVRFCNFQERSVRDVRTKLIEHAVYGSLQEEIISKLLEEDILNERRFAMSFVRGKFRYNTWGKNKISNELKFDQIPQSIITEALDQIDYDEYQQVIRKEIVKKGKSLKRKESNEVLLKRKIVSYLVQKGFSYQDIQECYQAGIPRF